MKSEHKKVAHKSGFQIIEVFFRLNDSPRDLDKTVPVRKFYIVKWTTYEFSNILNHDFRERRCPSKPRVAQDALHGLVWIIKAHQWLWQFPFAYLNSKTNENALCATAIRGKVKAGGQVRPRTVLRPHSVMRAAVTQPPDAPMVCVQFT